MNGDDDDANDAADAARPPWTRRRPGAVADAATRAATARGRTRAVLTPGVAHVADANAAAMPTHALARRAMVVFGRRRLCKERSGRVLEFRASGVGRGSRARCDAGVDARWRTELRDATAARAGVVRRAGGGRPRRLDRGKATRSGFFVNIAFRHVVQQKMFIGQLKVSAIKR
jgi:hypothetical protein